MSPPWPAQAQLPLSVDNILEIDRFCKCWSNIFNIYTDPYALGRWAQRRIWGGSGRVFRGRAAVGLAGASGAALSGGAELSCAGLLREGRWLGGREARRGGSLCSRCGGESGRVETCIVKFCVAGVCRFGNVSVWSGGSARRALSGPGGRSVLHAWLVAAIGGW